MTVFDMGRAYRHQKRVDTIAEVASKYDLTAEDFTQMRQEWLDAAFEKAPLAEVSQQERDSLYMERVRAHGSIGEAMMSTKRTPTAEEMKANMAKSQRMVKKGAPDWYKSAEKRLKPATSDEERRLVRELQKFTGCKSDVQQGDVYLLRPGLTRAYPLGDIVEVTHVTSSSVRIAGYRSGREVTVNRVHIGSYLESSLRLSDEIASQLREGCNNEAQIQNRARQAEMLLRALQTYYTSDSELVEENGNRRFAKNFQAAIEAGVIEPNELERLRKLTVEYASRYNAMNDDRTLFDDM
jgi:polyhydroxyalkanoate synthesis regulator protein